MHDVKCTHFLRLLVVSQHSFYPFIPIKPPNVSQSDDHPELRLHFPVKYAHSLAAKYGHVTIFWPTWCQEGHLWNFSEMSLREGNLSFFSALCPSPCRLPWGQYDHSWNGHLGPWSVTKSLSLAKLQADSFEVSSTRRCPWVFSVCIAQM